MWILKYTNHITAIAGLLIFSGLVGDFAGYGNIKEIMLITATAVASIPIFIKAFQALRARVFSIELLVTIAVVGALAIGEYMESAVVTFLFLFGAYLEARTLEKTRSSLKSLLDMAPQEATVVREGQSVTVPVEEVRIGDRLIIRSGGKVPVDGTVIAGQAYLNEAAVTGEPIPAAKEAGDKVFSGTLVDNGYIEIIAEKVGDDTTFAKIIELVEEAQEAKSQTARFLDKFANVYTPAIVALAVAVYLVTRNLHMAITFLVVACPGALVIGAPVSTVAGIGNGAKNGVLVKGGEVMDKLAKVDTVVFDKTGTLTKGRPEVTAIKTCSRYGTGELLRLVAIAETASEHHLGRAIVKAAEARNLSLDGKAEQVAVIKGGGIKCKVEGLDLVIGSFRLLANEGINVPPEVLDYVKASEQAGNTTVLAAVDGVVAGVISIADQIREDAPLALAELRKNGIKKIVMLTGDNKYTAALVAQKLGLDEFHAELLPENKVEFIKRLKGQNHIVAMAGDGINDAPAIAAADIGLAMGGGTDVSMETAEVVLMADKLLQFAYAYALAKATVKNMKQNIYFAVATVVVLLLGVLSGTVHLASGMFIHEASVLLVILNAMRLIKYRPLKT